MSLKDTIRGIAAGKATPAEARAEEDEQEEDAAAAAEDDEQDEGAAAADPSAQDDDEDDGDEESGKKSEEDEDEEGEKAEASSVRKARADERKRIRAILAAPGAARAPELAAHFAFETSMGAKDARAALDRVPEGGESGSALADRMSGLNPKLGTGAQGPAGNDPDTKLVQFAQKIAPKKAGKAA